MDRNTKFLKLLTTQERIQVSQSLEAIISQDISGLRVKKLSGYMNAYRVRVGSVRIIYLMHDDYNEVLYIGRRNEKTYKKF